MTIDHIHDGELGFDVRTKLNALIDQVAAGTGDVVGPASAIADSVAVYNGVTGKLIKDGGATIANIIASAIAGSGTGNVVGPASAVADRIAVYNGTTGKLIKDGGQTVAQVIAAAGMAIGGAITGSTAGRVLFVGPTGALAQDSGFTWDDIYHALNLQKGEIQAWGGYYLAFMDNPNVSANYFAGGSGHPGYVTSGAIQNVGLGPFALSCIIDGSNNMAVGSSALQFLTSGNDNVAIGINAIYSYNGNRTVAVGSSAGGGSRTSGDSNIFIGYSAASSISNTSSGNVWMGGYTGTASVFSNTIVFSDGAGTVKADCGFRNAGWTFAGSPKAGAPASTDLPSGFFSVIDDTSGAATWLVFNKSGTIRKVQLV